MGMSLKMRRAGMGAGVVMLAAGALGATKVQKRVAGDETGLAAAQARVEKAMYDLNIAVTQKQAAFDSSADYKAAKKAVVDAQGEVKTARAAVMAKMAGDPKYAALTAKEAAAQAQADKLKGENADPVAISAASQEVLRLGRETSAMERDALGADPAYKAASDKLVSANTAVTAMQDNFKQSLVNDPNLASLRREKGDAELRLSQLQAKLRSDESLLKHH